MAGTRSTAWVRGTADLVTNDQGADGGARTRRLALDRATGAIAVSRSFVHQVLAAWAWPDGRPTDDALLVVSELVTNAVRHGGGPTSLTLTHEPVGCLRIEIEDASPEAPRRHDSGAERPGGFGMQVVDRLCDAWGTEQAGTGKRVWASLPLPP